MKGLRRRLAGRGGAGSGPRGYAGLEETLLREPGSAAAAAPADRGEGGLVGLLVQVLAHVAGIFCNLWPGAPWALPALSAEQEAELAALKARNVPFDGADPAHRGALGELWGHAFPDAGPCPAGIKTERWKDMGWQGTDPGTDFRGAGFLALENLNYLAATYPQAFHRLRHKTQGTRSSWEYPFAVAGVNVTFMLLEVFTLNKDALRLQEPAPRAFAGMLGGGDPHVFDDVYCAVFDLLDAVWLEQGATYMEFGQVQKAVKQRLEDALKARPPPASAAALREALGVV